ncbi:unnamed protein product, partial [Adineta steineri]
QPLGENVKIANDENGLAALVFDSTTLADKCGYIAKATNIVGSVEQKINLDVKGMYYYQDGNLTDLNQSKIKFKLN